MMGDKLAAWVFYRSSNSATEMRMQQAHISALQNKHADIEARITEESQRPRPDEAALARLKKEKLRVKEAIAGLH
ncbi:YdcH family protein [Allosphingosinicella deserti]